jgi:hypothetical protein
MKLRSVSAMSIGQQQSSTSSIDAALRPGNTPDEVGKPQTPGSGKSSSMLRRVSAWYAVLALLGGAAVTLTASTVNDPDLYWHRLLGAEWLSGHTALSPDPISYSPGIGWFSTSWLTEVLYAGIVAETGYQGIIWLRLFLATLFFAGLAVVLRRGASLPATVITFAAVGLPVFGVLQDRPQTFSLLLLLLVASQLDVAMRTASLPNPILIGVFTWLWANLHGLWVIVPCLIATLACASAIDHRTTRARLGQYLLGLVAAVAGAALTPVGPRLLLSPWRIQGATSEISEWQHTQLFSPVAFGLTAALVFIFIGWARQHEPVTRGEVLVVLVCALMGLSAFRLAVPASLLLAVIAARRLDAVAPVLRRSTATLPRIVPLVMLLAVSGLAVGKYAAQPAVPSQFPHDIAAYLHQVDHPVRVMPAYNISGFVREFGGDHVRLAIDGRADRYGAQTIHRYVSTMSGEGSWRRTVAAYDPDFIVTEKASALNDLLADDGWRKIDVDASYVLYGSPDPQSGS